MYGYLAAYVLEFAAVYYIVYIAFCHSSFFIGSCEILMAFALDLKQEFHVLIKNPDQNQAELKKKLSEFVQFHCDAKQLRINSKRFDSFQYISNNSIDLFHMNSRQVEKFGVVYKFIITNLALWSIWNICSTLLVVQIEIVEYINNKLQICVEFSLLFLF